MNESDTLALHPFMNDRTLRQILLWLFHFWILVVPFVFTAINDELFEFNKMVFTYAMATLIGAVWILRMILTKKIIWKHTLLFWPIALYLFSHILSTAFSIHPHTSVFGYYSRFHGGLLSSITYIVMFFALVSNFHWRDLFGFVRTALIAALGVCLYAIPEHFGVSPSCIIITGEASVGCWVQDVQTRVFATFGQPNWLAAYLLMITPLAWWYVAVAWRKNHHIGHLLLGSSTLILSVITLLYTRSRSGFLGLAFELTFLTLATLTLVWFQQKPGSSLTSSLREKLTTTFFAPLFGTLIATAVVIMLLGSPFTPSASEVVQKLSTSWQTEYIEAEPSPTPLPTSDPTPASGTVLENGGTDSGDIRRIVWEGSLKVWQRYPIFGSGLDTFAYSYYRDRPAEHNQVSEWDFLYNRAHNEFINTLATTGSVGFMALLFLMGMFIIGISKDILHLVRQKNESLSSDFLPVIFLIALLAGYGGLAISNFFGFSTVVVGAFFFIYKAWWELLRRSWTHENEDDEILSTPQKSASELLQVQTPRTKKNKKKKYVEEKKSRVSRSQAVSTDSISWNENIFGAIGVGIVTIFLLANIWNIWQSDHLLALSKGHLSQGSGTLAYSTLQDLVTRAPLEPTYVDQQAVTLARLAAGTHEQDATTASRLAEEAIFASNKAITLNPVHLNFWKNRARVFIMLATIDTQYYVQALDALHRARELAPTDVKLVYNIALILDTLNETPSAREAYTDTIAMKPDYEEARNSFGQFLEKQEDYQGAYEQYRYILDHLNPTAPTATERLEALSPKSESGLDYDEASTSGKIAP